MKHSTKRGATLTGYGLIVGLLAIVSLGAITSIGSQVDELFTEVGTELDSVITTGAASGGTTPAATQTPLPASFASCLAASQAGVTTSGIYTLDIGSGEFQVYCDMSPSSPGWTLVMRGVQSDNAGGGWFVTTDLNTSFATQNLATSSWKFGDSTINGLGGTLFRLQSDSSGTYGSHTRYWDASACTYAHTTEPTPGGPCHISYPDEALSTPSGTRSGPTGVHGGLSDWNDANTLYFITADSRSQWTWFVGDNQAGGVGVGYDGYTAGGFQMWVR